MTPSRLAAIIIMFVIGLVALSCSSKLFESLDASQIMVIQSPFSGELTVHTTPGTKWQGFGTVTKYDRQRQLWFAKDSGPKGTDEGIKVRFNDGGHGTLYGSVSWKMPLDNDHVIDLHKQYGSSEAIEESLLNTNLSKSVYMSGPLMSSTESYAVRRNELLGLIDDQFTKGIYQTSSRDERSVDPITKEQKTIKIVEPVKGADGMIARVEESPLISFAIQTFNLSFNDLKYDEQVEAQIQKQQEATMSVQTAIADTKKAEQEKLTTISKGEAEAAKAEWEQKRLMATEVTKAEQEKQVAVTKAQQELEVAQLKTQASEQQKLSDILLGEGEATRRKLVMDADGALEKKLAAYTEVNFYYAQAMGQYGGSWVPSIIMGGSEGKEVATAGGGADQLIALLTAKTAKDLKVDLSVPEKSGSLPEIKRPSMPTFQLKRPDGKSGWGGATSFLSPLTPTASK